MGNFLMGRPRSGFLQDKKMPREDSCGRGWRPGFCGLVGLMACCETREDMRRQTCFTEMTSFIIRYPFGQVSNDMTLEIIA
ncbi:hypothetical protein IH879_03510 [candidate division KSB1 bacterium]|nr:hypothetical protein [candidate division KSB1 bacterium]